MHLRYYSALNLVAFDNISNFLIPSENMYQALDWKVNNQSVEEQTDGKVKKVPTKEKSTLKVRIPYSISAHEKINSVLNGRVECLKKQGFEIWIDL